MSYECESLVAVIVALWITLFLSIVYNILSPFKMNLLQEEFFYKIEWHLPDQIFFTLNYSLSSFLCCTKKPSKFKLISLEDFSKKICTKQKHLTSPSYNQMSEVNRYFLFKQQNHTDLYLVVVC